MNRRPSRSSSRLGNNSTWRKACAHFSGRSNPPFSLFLSVFPTV